MRVFGVWKTLRDKGSTASMTPMPQLTDSSNLSPIAAILLKMKMNEMNADIQEEGLFQLAR